jgi:hypothetical protein
MGWSGSASASFGGSLSKSRTRQLADRDLTLPDIVDDLQRFIRKIGQIGIQTRIGIDELDKMDRDDAAKFLNSIKAIFGVENCFFLVSVSDDALSDFERRGLPLRNAFDSSLYEIVRVNVLDFDGAKRLLNSRTLIGEPFPANFAALCFCLSGGLPRDLVRLARRMIELNGRLQQDAPGDHDGSDMATLANSLLRDDWRAKAASTWIPVSRLPANPAVSSLLAWLWYAERDILCPEEVVSESADLSERSRTAQLPSPAGEGSDQLSTLAVETSGYRYFIATALQFFSLDEQLIARALSTETGLPAISTMAHARMTFARDPRLAWALVSEFRTACDLLPASTPPDPGAPMLGWFADAANARLSVSGARAGQP